MAISVVDAQQGNPVPALTGLQDGDTLFGFTSKTGVSLGLIQGGLLSTDSPPWCPLAGTGTSVNVGLNTFWDIVFRRWSTGDPTSYQFMRSGNTQQTPATDAGIIVAYRGLKPYDFRLTILASSGGAATPRTLGPSTRTTSDTSDVLMLYVAVGGCTWPAAITERITDGTLQIADEIISPSSATFVARTMTFSGFATAVARYESLDNNMS